MVHTASLVHDFLCFFFAACIPPRAFGCIVTPDTIYTSVASTRINTLIFLSTEDGRGKNLDKRLMWNGAKNDLNVSSIEGT